MAVSWLKTKINGSLIKKNWALCRTEELLKLIVGRLKKKKKNVHRPLCIFYCSDIKLGRSQTFTRSPYTVNQIHLFFQELKVELLYEHSRELPLRKSGEKSANSYDFTNVAKRATRPKGHILYLSSYYAATSRFHERSVWGECAK